MTKPAHRLRLALRQGLHLPGVRPWPFRERTDRLPSKTPHFLLHPKNRRPARAARRVNRVGLLARLVLDRLLDLLFDSIQVEGSRILHRRIVNRRKGQFLDHLLNKDEPPELASKEVIHIAPAEVIEVLA